MQSTFCRQLAAMTLALIVPPLAMADEKSADEKATSTEVAGQRIFTAGHSFHYYLPPILADVAAKAKVDGHKQVGLQALGGSRVIQHWELSDDKNKAKMALMTGEVDVLTLSPIYLPDDGIEKFARLALEKNPEARITVQEFWLPFDDQAAWQPAKRPKELDRDQKTIDQLREAHAPYFKSMDEHVEQLNEQLGKIAVVAVPVGQAVLGLREKVIAGQAPGIKSQNALFTDVLGHAHPPVMVLAAYCHFATIYRRTPVGLPVPLALARQPEADALNKLLQELAWVAVSKHPLSGVTAEAKGDKKK